MKKTEIVKKHRDRRPLDALKDDFYARAMHDDMDHVLPVNHSEVDKYDKYKYDDQYRINEYYDKHAGRYPIGLRHYESYENYRQVYPNATMQDYHETSKKLLYFKISLIKQYIYLNFSVQGNFIR